MVANAELDTLTLEDLLHVDDQKETLVANTEQLLAGLPANNVLMWGARGTGKSSLIHALLNAYVPQGLRLVEVSREQLADLGDVVAQLATSPYKFIIFLDFPSVHLLAIYHLYCLKLEARHHLFELILIKLNLIFGEHLEEFRH